MYAKSLTSVVVRKNLHACFYGSSYIFEWSQQDVHVGGHKGEPAETFDLAAYKGYF